MGYSSHELAVLNYRAAAHSSDDSAREGDEGGVGDLDLEGFRAGRGPVDLGYLDLVGRLFAVFHEEARALD